MATNKVVYGNTTLIDLTGDDVTAGDVLSGKSFHLRSGAAATGTLDLDDYMTWEANGILGAKNFWIPFTTNSYENNGITFTQNADKSVSASGTASATALWRQSVTIPKGSYIISGGLSSNNFVALYNYNTNTYFVRSEGSDSSPYTFNADTQVGLTVRIASGQTLSGATFYPMIRLSSDKDNTYAPYAMTNLELTNKNPAWGEVTNKPFSSIDTSYGLHVNYSSLRADVSNYIISGTPSASTYKSKSIKYYSGSGATYYTDTLEKYMETNITLSTSASVTATFTNSDITNNSIIEVVAGRTAGDDTNGGQNVFPYENVTVSVSGGVGTCEVVFPKFESAIGLTVGIYIK